MSFYHDPELPAGFQDADIEQAEMEREGRHITFLRKEGICTHQSWVGLPASGKIFYPEQEDLLPGEVRCTDLCKEKFSDEDSLRHDSRQKYNG